MEDAKELRFPFLGLGVTFKDKFLTYQLCSMESGYASSIPGQTIKYSPRTSNDLISPA
jgi:hypothetical protein